MMERLKRAWWSLLTHPRMRFSPGPDFFLGPAASDAQGGVEYVEVFPEQASDVTELVALDGRPVSFFAPPSRTIPSAGVYRVAQGTVVPRPAGIMTRRWQMLAGLSRVGFELDELRWPRNPKHYPVRELSGTSVSLVSDYAHNNYGHFLLDGIGRLAILQQWDPSAINDCDHVVVSGPHTGWKARLLARAGIPGDKVVYLAGEALRCEQIIAPSFPGCRSTYPSWLVRYLQQNLGSPTQGQSPSGRRLFLNRKGTTRMLTNQAILFDVAKRYGFELYTPELASDPIADFAQAEVVISPHGAALTDIAFMPPGARVLELLPDDHMHCYFYTLAVAADLAYDCIVGPSETRRTKEAWGPSDADFSIPMELFEQYLERQFSGRAGDGAR